MRNITRDIAKKSSNIGVPSKAHTHTNTQNSKNTQKTSTNNQSKYFIGKPSDFNPPRLNLLKMLTFQMLSREQKHRKAQREPGTALHQVGRCSPNFQDSGDGPGRIFSDLPRFNRLRIDKVDFPDAALGTSVVKKRRKKGGCSSPGWPLLSKLSGFLRWTTAHLFRPSPLQSVEN